VHRPPIDATHLAAPGAVVALTGISHSERVGEAQLDALNRISCWGTRSCSAPSTPPGATTTAEALAAADSGWLARLITGRLAVRNWPAALQKRPEDIKIVVYMTAAG
jgi:hypothetical protein